MDCNIPGSSVHGILLARILEWGAIAFSAMKGYFMANRWGKVETVTDFIFLGSKITVDGDYSHETKRHLRLERKAMTNIDSVLKGTWPTKVYGFSSSHVWM